MYAVRIKGSGHALGRIAAAIVAFFDVPAPKNGCSALEAMYNHREPMIKIVGRSPKGKS